MTVTYKPSALTIYRDTYLVQEPPARLGADDRADLDRLESALRLFDSAATPSRRIAVSVYFYEEQDLVPGVYVTLMNGDRSAPILTAGPIHEGALLCEALAVAADL